MLSNFYECELASDDTCDRVPAVALRMAHITTYSAKFGSTSATDGVVILIIIMTVVVVILIIISAGVIPASITLDTVHYGSVASSVDVSVVAVAGLTLPQAGQVTMEAKRLVTSCL
jgi:hypothetical protein